MSEARDICHAGEDGQSINNSCHHLQLRAVPLRMCRNFHIDGHACNLKKPMIIFSFVFIVRIVIWIPYYKRCRITLSGSSAAD